ncbi:hypothetical protein [Synechococcus sp. NOUM97013]|uniref:hypothetical protein n=1 Tax=Synechococcus sp. NOUM97013 TaxID=1442555 RepID=UPI00185F7FBE|nr:hypothetical protein [Synechococcus sp. NOUM97013]QNI72332.1 HAD-like and RmlC-like cupin domain-containing protein [Synechococcus sp. NOUM97013]
MTDVSKIKGLIFDFDGVFTDNTVCTHSDGVESVKCSKYDSYAINIFRQDFPEIPLVVISSETNTCIKHRCSKLEINLIQGVSDKLDAAKKWALNCNISLVDCAFLANDLNDKRLCQVVGFPYGVGDCNDALSPFVRGKTVSFGGNGAIKEFLELICFSNLHRRSRHVSIEKLSATSVGPREWGEELLIAKKDGHFTFKQLTLKKGASGGLQFHRLKNEVVYVLSGCLLVKHDRGDGKLIEDIFSKGDCVQFPPGSIHQEIALEQCVLLEVSTPHFNDRVRVESLYGLTTSDTNSSLPSTSLLEIRNEF